MNDHPNNLTADEAFLCRVLIGLYIFIFAVFGMLHIILGSIMGELYATNWRVLRTLFTSQQFSVPTTDDIFSCGAFALVNGGAFLFLQYILRLWSRVTVVSPRMLWVLTAIHAMGIILWICYAAWHERRAFERNLIQMVSIVWTVCAPPLMVFLSALAVLLSRGRRDRRRNEER